MRPGLRDELITEALRARLAELPPERLEREGLDPAEAALRLARHLSSVTRRALDALPEEERPQRQAELINEITTGFEGADGDRIALPPEVLLGVLAESSRGLGIAGLPPRPEIPLGVSDLLFNGTGQPSLGTELRAELESAERVDLLCAFVIWSGTRVLRPHLTRLAERGGRIRVITTTYMGATEPRALEALVELGAEVKVAFDARTTKLHAKSWILERPGGLTTAFVGSSNLSHTALHEGLEWNVRLAEADVPHLIERIHAAFEAHWADEHFEPFNPPGDSKKLTRALGLNAGRRRGESVSFAGLDVHPYPHQRRMLEALAIERERHDRHRNLIVAATGTGKTVVAALDYRALRASAGGDLSLLYVAHRRRILEQGQATFRAVLHATSFGELLGDGELPREGKHVFAMIQSLDEARIAALARDEFDVVIVDEFHHAAAPTYARLLERLRPRELVGMTATPERMDGADVTEWFDRRIAVELRLWEAIDQGFLVPFQYFGIADGTDLSQLQWRRGGYLDRDLSKVLTGDDVRVAKILAAIEELIPQPQDMRALGFCVSIEHAEYMAHRFNEAGLTSAAVSGDTPTDERDDVLRRLGGGELSVVFSVDVLGEGVDIPDVDTVLLLRPTQSATVFSQQLGRGLRRAEGKSCLTVIDLIGQQHRQFRFDRRLEALHDPTQGSLTRQVEQGFPLLPAGCDVSLDRVAREIVLGNLRDAAHLGQWRTLVDDLRSQRDTTLGQFLDQTDRAPEDLYRSPRASWTALQRAAGRTIPASPSDTEEKTLLRAVGRMLHLDDPERVAFYGALLSEPRPPVVGSLDERHRRLLLMLHFGLWGVRNRFDSLDVSLKALWRHSAVREELVQLLGVLDERSSTVGRPSGLRAQLPVTVHARYSRDEVLGAFDVGSTVRPPQLREGVRWVEEERADLLFVTLRKSERGYSPTTMYRDYAISPTLFHWESQSTLGERAPTAQRYIHHAERGSDVFLFVRDRPKDARGQTSPYVCLGQATYVSHRGERPLAITWELPHPMPEAVFAAARTVAAA